MANMCVLSHVRLCNPMDCSPPGSSVHGISRERLLDCRFLLQGIFLTQGLNPCLLYTLHWQADSLPTGLPGKPNRRGKSERFYFLGLQNHCNDDCSHEIQRHLLLGRKAMTNLDSILKSRDITLPTKVHLVKAIVFPVVMYVRVGP